MNKPNIKHINVHELKSLMDANPNLCLIDVREVPEWQEARIPGAVHIPKDQIVSGIRGIMLDKNQPIYLHCRSGVRSAYAAQLLIDNGYKDVCSVDGGILDWATYGYPIEQ
jgi:rhodanese-related sulfurtransferase